MTIGYRLHFCNIVPAPEEKVFQSSCLPKNYKGKISFGGRIYKVSGKPGGKTHSEHFNIKSLMVFYRMQDVLHYSSLSRFYWIQELLQRNAKGCERRHTGARWYGRPLDICLLLLLWPCCWGWPCWWEKASFAVIQGDSSLRWHQKFNQSIHTKTAIISQFW